MTCECMNHVPVRAVNWPAPSHDAPGEDAKSGCVSGASTDDVIRCVAGPSPPAAWLSADSGPSSEPVKPASGSPTPANLSSEPSSANPPLSALVYDPSQYWRKSLLRSLHGSSQSWSHGTPSHWSAVAPAT